MRVICILLSCLLLAGALASCDMIAKGKLESAVKEALKKDSRTSQFEFEVSQQDDGSIIITGEVLQPSDIDAVTEVAKAVPGVKDLINRCAVPEPGSDLVQDTTTPMF